MEALEKELQKCKPESVKLIVVDGVFSMEGDLANLPEIVRLKDKYNASIMVDEAMAWVCSVVTGEESAITSD